MEDRSLNPTHVSDLPLLWSVAGSFFDEKPDNFFIRYQVKVETDTYTTSVIRLSLQISVLLIIKRQFKYSLIWCLKYNNHPTLFFCHFPFGSQRCLQVAAVGGIQCCWGWDFARDVKSDRGGWDLAVAILEVKISLAFCHCPPYLSMHLLLPSTHQPRIRQIWPPNSLTCSVNYSVMIGW